MVAAAAVLDRAGDSLSAAGVAIGSRAGQLGEVWSGRAADAAMAAITGLGRRAVDGADVLDRVGPVLRVYAAELAAAQADHAAASTAAGSAVDAGTAAAARADAAELLAPTDVTRAGAQQAAAYAVEGAAVDATAARDALTAAVARAAQANETAAAAIDRLTAQLDVLGPDTPGGASPICPAPDPGDHKAGKGWDWAALAVDAVSGAPVTPGGGQGLKDQVGGIGEAAWDIGPGTISWALGLGNDPTDQQISDDITATHDRLEQAYDADTHSTGYRFGNIAGQLAGIVIPGGGEAKAAKAAREAPELLDDAAAVLGAAVKAEPLADRLASARVVATGRIPETGGPSGGLVVKRDPEGHVTNYVVYDSHGYAVKRVDLTGRAHAGVPTPHVKEFQQNIGPDGVIHIGPKKGAAVRPAQPDEIP